MKLCWVSVVVALLSLSSGGAGAMRSLWELPENFRYTFLGLESANDHPLHCLTDKVSHELS